VRVPKEFTEFVKHVEDACLADPNRFEVLVIERSPLDVLEIFLRSNRDAYSESKYDALVGCARMIMDSDVWSRSVHHILLDVDVATCMERIRRRGCGGEDLISADYMHTLDTAYRDLARTTPGITVLLIRSDMDRVAVVKRVLDVISSEIQ
jgi:deoxyadenosine/deoxycytidine kinase